MLIEEKNISKNKVDYAISFKAIIINKKNNDLEEILNKKLIEYSENYFRIVTKMINLMKL